MNSRDGKKESDGIRESLVAVGPIWEVSHGHRTVHPRPRLPEKGDFNSTPEGCYSR